MQKLRIHKIQGLLFSQTLGEVSGENYLFNLIAVTTQLVCTINYMRVYDLNVQGHNGCIGKHWEFG